MTDKEYIELLHNGGDLEWSSALAVYSWAPTMEGFFGAIDWKNMDIITPIVNKEAGTTGARTAVPGVELSELLGSAIRSYTEVIILDMPKWVTVRMLACMRLATTLLGRSAANLLKEHFEDVTRVPLVIQGTSRYRTGLFPVVAATFKFELCL